MRASSPKRAWHLAVGIGLLLVGVLTFAVVRHPHGGFDAEPNPTGENVLAGISPASIPAALDRLDWPDVGVTAEAAAADTNLLATVLYEADRSTNPPTCYLAALLHLSKGEAEVASTLFALIPATAIPPEHLYAPDRLSHELHPNSPNPYRPLLLEAMKQNRLSALIAARLRAQQGEFKAALEAYLRSDTSRWANQDAILMSAMMQHAGVGTEAVRIVRGALRAGRVPQDVRTSLTQAISRIEQRHVDPELNAKLSSYLKNHPDVQAAAVKAITNQLELRRTFASRHYREVLEQFRKSEPITLPEETILFLVLSAAHESEIPSFERWSAELKRRNPQPEVAQWIRQIKTEMQ